MPSFVWSQLRSRLWRALALGGAILIAAASFTLLTAAGKTTDIRVEGSVTSNYRTAYDILVRPTGSQTPLEVSQGLVRDNYLSGLFGGITLAQWRTIEGLHGVEVAAPVANIGYVIPLAFPEVPMNDLLSRDSAQLYRIRNESVADAGTSHYPGATNYVFVAPHASVVANSSACNQPFTTGSGPFARWIQVNCYSSGTRVVGGEEVWFPILLAGIDPTEEGRLLGLSQTMVSGRYLQEGEVPQLDLRAGHRLVPVIASTNTYVDEHVVMHIERLAIPAGADVQRLLANRTKALPFLKGLQGREIATRVIPAQVSYEDALRGIFGSTGGQNVSDSYWTASPVDYTEGRTGPLVPLAIENPLSIWLNSPPGGGYLQTPMANADLQFRHLYPHVGSPYFTGPYTIMNTPVIHIVGRYDPTRLAGFSALSKVPLETYYPPELLPGDAASSRALKGQPLLPSQNVGDYVAQPPLFLTTLQSIEPFLNSTDYTGVNAKAPISVIRVRVAGVTGPDALSQARVRAVATQIHDRTGLQVDITAGSSPQELLVQLPAGQFGRPALLLQEGWSKKGVAVSFILALDRKRLGLLSLILVACTFFLANGAFASVRGRRREIGTLLCVGWPRRAIFRAVLSELIVVGAAGGVAAFGVAIAVARVLSLDLPVLRAALVVPLGVALAAVAGFVPAWRAAQSVPLDAITPAVSIGAKRRRIRRLVPLALANIRRMPARSLVAASGVFMASAVLTLLLAINEAFQGSLVGTLLGNAISLQVRGLDFLAVGVIALLAALSLADVTYLNLRERAAEIVTLKTVGWSDGYLRRLIATEAAMLALSGSVPGAAVGLFLGVHLGVSASALFVASSVSVAASVVVAVFAALVPLAKLSAPTAPSVLGEE